MKNIRISETTDGMNIWNGNVMASTWLQCAPDEGVGGLFMTPGGRADISDVNADIDNVNLDAGKPPPGYTWRASAVAQ